MLDSALQLKDQLEELKRIVKEKGMTKTRICKEFGVSFYELNKYLGCGYKKRNGKRGRKKLSPEEKERRRLLRLENKKINN